VPNVLAARTPVNSRFIAPCRSRSMSSIESAPATIPATRALTLAGAFGDGTLRCSASNSDKPARSANASTGASPAYDMPETRVPF
jgi:hypothetical protein